mmetsp:Transcript_3521/g.12412  ORF Transcript_3521/g.12412 Transcript_3521/m.12412 type:complete len:382 (-) Transcript_3521:136-1281(-)
MLRCLRLDASLSCGSELRLQQLGDVLQRCRVAEAEVEEALLLHNLALRMLAHPLHFHEPLVKLLDVAGVHRARAGERGCEVLSKLLSELVHSLHACSQLIGLCQVAHQCLEGACALVLELRKVAQATDEQAYRLGRESVLEHAVDECAKDVEDELLLGLQDLLLLLLRERLESRLLRGVEVAQLCTLERDSLEEGGLPEMAVLPDLVALCALEEERLLDRRLVNVPEQRTCLHELCGSVKVGMLERGSQASQDDVRQELEGLPRNSTFGGHVAEDLCEEDATVIQLEEVHQELQVAPSDGRGIKDLAHALLHELGGSGILGSHGGKVLGRLHLAEVAHLQVAEVIVPRGLRLTQLLREHPGLLVLRGVQRRELGLDLAQNE